jgi:predicted nucleic acid-binding protein
VWSRKKPARLGAAQQVEEGIVVGIIGEAAAEHAAADDVCVGEILEEAIEGRRALLAPDLLESEFANLLWKKVRRGECSEEIAAEVLALWETDRPGLIVSQLLVHRALELAFRLDHPVYDCLYLAAAIEYAAAFATADTRLARAARGVVADIVIVE